MDGDMVVTTTLDAAIPAHNWLSAARTVRRPHGVRPLKVL